MCLFRPIIGAGVDKSLRLLKKCDPGREARLGFAAGTVSGSAAICHLGKDTNLR